jgi:hypothetical protein
MFADNVPSGGVNGSRPNGSAIDLLVVPIRGGVRGGLDEKVCPQADERCGNSTGMANLRERVAVLGVPNKVLERGCAASSDRRVGNREQFHL